MKKILINLIFTFIIHIYGYGQEFIESKEFQLTKFEYSDFMKIQSEDEKFDGYMSIFLKNKKGDSIKEIKVYAESYENDATVQEYENVKLKNTKKIIRVRISQCACYCNTSIYFWLITKQGEWIELPTIENEDYEFEMKYKDYVFSKSGRNEIQLMEYKDEFIEKENYDNSNIRRKSEKALKILSWNGKEILEK